jgi:hypothetical protein
MTVHFKKNLKYKKNWYSSPSQEKIYIYQVPLITPDRTLCDKVCQWLTTGSWFSPRTLISSTNKTDHYDITLTL